MRSILSAVVAARGASKDCAKCHLQSRLAVIASPRTSAKAQTTSLLQTRLYSSSGDSNTNTNSTETPKQQQQPLDSKKATTPETFYDLFPGTLPSGPPPAGHFPIDLTSLRREFLRLQSRHHPDKHASQHAKNRADGASALINEAYKTLANPLLRAQYLLSLRGVDVANDENLKVEEPDLLMEVLEAREEIEDAVEEEHLEEPRRVNEERIRESEERLEEMFRNDDVEGAKRESVRLRYWVNIRESLDNWERGKPIVLEH